MSTRQCRVFFTLEGIRTTAAWNCRDKQRELGYYSQPDDCYLARRPSCSHETPLFVSRTVARSQRIDRQLPVCMHQAQTESGSMIDLDTGSHCNHDFPCFTRPHRNRSPHSWNKSHESATPAFISSFRGSHNSTKTATFGIAQQKQLKAPEEEGEKKMKGRREGEGRGRRTRGEGEEGKRRRGRRGRRRSRGLGLVTK